MLQSVGKRVYGFDGTQGRLMVSSDGGRAWARRTPPGGVFSLATDPSSADRFVASTERGLFISDDVGRTFRPLESRAELAGLLAWPTPGRLVLVDGDGRLLRSADRGATWQAVGSIEGQPAALIAAGGELYAALTDNTVKRSADGGRTWTLAARP